MKCTIVVWAEKNVRSWRTVFSAVAELLVLVSGGILISDLLSLLLLLLTPRIFSTTGTDERFLTKNEVIFSVEQCDRDEESRINKRVSNI